MHAVLCNTHTQISTENFIFGSLVSNVEMNTEEEVRFKSPFPFRWMSFSSQNSHQNCIGFIFSPSRKNPVTILWLNCRRKRSYFLFNLCLQSRSFFHSSNWIPQWNCIQRDRCLPSSLSQPTKYIYIHLIIPFRFTYGNGNLSLWIESKLFSLCQ